MSDLILPTDEQVERAVNAVKQANAGHPDIDMIGEAAAVTCFETLLVLLNKDKILGEFAPASAYFEPPYALTEDHVASLERAIRAEGYNIKVDTETGEVKLYVTPASLTRSE